MKNQRSSGILLPITALPNNFGIGDFGHSAYEFCHFLKEAGQRYWEILPINSLFGRSGITAHTPYGATSCFAGNILLISPQYLLLDGDVDHLPPTEFDPHKHHERIADYQELYHYKWAMLKKAYQFSGKQTLKSEDFKNFCKKNDYWLERYAHFELLSKLAGTEEHPESDFRKWKESWKTADALEVLELGKAHYEEMNCIKYAQFIFFKQWNALKNFANTQGIQIIGDLPIYSNSKSADLWSFKKFFKLDEHDLPTHTGGTPPDVFSPVGQNWKAPVYDWEFAQKNQYEWHRKRVKHQLEMFDVLRLDHYQGYITYWEIPADKSAQEGRWQEVPSEELFDCFHQDTPNFKVIVEDLGAMTVKAKEIMKKYQLAGMNVLEYAFHENDSSYQPHHHLKNSVCFIGTHDNTTAQGLYHSAGKEYLKRLSHYVGHPIHQENFHWEMIRLCLSSPAFLSILQAQDLLGLDDTYRTNNPLSYIDGVNKDKNWTFRLKQLKDLHHQAKHLKELCLLYGRSVNKS